MKRLLSKIHSTLRRSRAEHDLAREVDSHLTLIEEDYRRRGLSPEEARLAARRAFGGVEQAKERQRDARSFVRIEDLRQDVRYALRSLRRTPGFALVAVLTLAVGIGANTAIFSVADPLLARPLRIPDLDRVAAVSIGQHGPVAPADFLDWKQFARSFEQLAAYRQRNENLTGEGVPERVFASAVTPGFFDVVQIQPAIGRVLRTDEDQPGHDRVALLGDGFWRRRFGGDPNVLGRTIDLDGQPYTIVGVMPKGFELPAPTDVWLPLVLTGTERTERKTGVLHVIGRLKPGATIASAQTEMSTIGRRLESAYPATNAGRLVHVVPLASFVVGSITRAALFLLLEIVAVVLLIASANIAGLQLARGTSRARELAVRAALGASRLRVAQMVFVESFVIALAGGVGGLFVAWGLLRLLLHAMPGEIARLIPGWDRIQIDWRVLAFTAAVALGSGIIAGLLPAWSASRRNPNDALKDGARRLSIGPGHHRLRGALVISQIAVALAFVVIAAQGVRGFQGLLHLEGAHDPSHVLVMSVGLPAARYADDASRVRFYQAALDRLKTLPGVESATTLSAIPLSNNGTTWVPFEIEGRPAAPGREPYAVFQSVSPEYFHLMRIGMRSGRTLMPTDDRNTTPIAVVSAALAAYCWPHASAIGKRIRMDDHSPWLLIVGVADDVLYDWTNRVPEPVIYRPTRQAPTAAAMLAIRTRSDASDFVGRARSQLAAIDPLLPAYDVMTLQQAISESLAGNGPMVSMVGLLGILALIIALVGIYSLVAHAVAAGTHEFGIRMALGASRIEILVFVLRRGTWLMLAGIGVGVALALVLSKVAWTMTYGAGAIGPTLILAVAAPLAAVVLLACAIPARRAARVDPMIALRAE